MLLTDKEMERLNRVIKASGYVYNNGGRTPERFAEIFGFNPSDYPEYFEINKNNLVIVTRLFRQHTEAAFNKYQEDRKTVLSY